MITFLFFCIFLYCRIYNHMYFCTNKEKNMTNHHKVNDSNFVACNVDQFHTKLLEGAVYFINITEDTMNASHSASCHQILEWLKRNMYLKRWCHSVIVVPAGAVLLVLGAAGELVRQAEAVVAYSTQNQPSIYFKDFTNQKLESFSELWQGIFLWGFFSILFIHIVSAIIAFLMLRRHKYGR